jgi:hypothetical protein
LVFNGSSLAIFFPKLLWDREKSEKRRQITNGRANERGWKEKHEDIWEGTYLLAYLHTYFTEQSTP